MTSQSPRIYTYKITFEEVPYYYYGVKKEKYFNGEYWGSPHTNKWCWELYTPKKQILQVFPYTDEGWIEAQEVEKRLIKPVFNTDKWCLNENVGGNISLECLSRSGKISGNKTKELGIGVHGRTPEQMTEDGKKGGTKTKELSIGIYGRTPEQHSKDSGKAGTKVKELGIGIYGRTPEQHSEDSKKAGAKTKELGIGIHGLTLEQIAENSKKGGKKTSAQKWMCLETGYVTNAGALTCYQKKRNIDTSKRIRIA
jgi:hypothetical protein